MDNIPTELINQGSRLGTIDNIITLARQEENIPQHWREG